MEPGVCAEYKVENDLSVTQGFRILSACPIDPAKPCKGFGDNCLWIITEADRSVTTCLLQDEYQRHDLTPLLHQYGVLLLITYFIKNKGQANSSYLTFGTKIWKPR